MPRQQRNRRDECRLLHRSVHHSSFEAIVVWNSQLVPEVRCFRMRREALARSPRGEQVRRQRRRPLERAHVQRRTCRACDRGRNCAACARSCGTRAASHGISLSSNSRTSRLSAPGPKSRSSKARAEHHVHLVDLRQADHRVELAELDARVRLLERLAQRAAPRASRRSRGSPPAASTGRSAARSRACTAARDRPTPAGSRRRSSDSGSGSCRTSRRRGAAACRRRECAARGRGEPQWLQNFIAVARAGRPSTRQLQEVLAVVLQLVDRFVDVGERLVLAFLGEALHELGLPAPHQLLQRRHVEVAVVEIVLERRHPAREEAPVLADRVAAHRRRLRRHVLAQERERRALDVRPRSSVDALTLSIRPERPCVPWFHESIASSTASSWCTTHTGACGDRVELRVGDHAARSR